MRRLVHVIPDAFKLHPFELFFSFMASVSATSTLLGLPGQNNALHRVLPHWFVQAWALSLLVGSAALVCGATSVVRIDGRAVVRRVACYRLGLRLLGGASFVYGLALFAGAGRRALVVAPIVFAVSAACYLRHADVTDKTSHE